MYDSLHKILLLPYKLTFRPPLVYLREPLFSLLHSINKYKFLQVLRRRECRIHSSIEIRSNKSFASYIEMGKYCIFEKDCVIWIADEEESDPKLCIDENVYFGRDVYLGVYFPLQIGKNSLIGAYSYIITANHQFNNVNIPIRLQGYKGAAVYIGEDVWIGCHVVVLPGITIGNGAVIAAGAVVTHNVPAFEVWGGIPANKISMRGVSTKS